MSGERIDYTIERQRHERFVGRAAVLARLDQLLVTDATDRWVLVTGGPGMGKSAILAAWLRLRQAAGAVVPHHFIRRGEYDWDDPAKLVSSLVAQLEERFPDQREPEVDAQQHPAARLVVLLARISARELVHGSERLVVMIDGLDEYDPPSDSRLGDPLAAFLPHALPRGVRILCASRPRHPHVAMLEARDGDLARIDLDDPDLAADNEATVRAFWSAAAPSLLLGARVLEEAIASAAGNLQHAVMLRKHLDGLPVTHRRIEGIPSGLAALLAKLWERIATDSISVHGLGILCAAREALTLDEIGLVAGWAGGAERQAFLRGARELLLATRRPDGQPEYRLHHEAIHAHIASTIGAVALRRHHAALAQHLAAWPAPADAMTRRYALRHALTHRAEAWDWVEVWRLAADMGFLEAKCHELGVHDAEADVARAAERCNASGDERFGHYLDDLTWALGRESHWLRTAPEGAAALVWNRLRRSGWSPAHLDARLRIPAEATFLRVRHRAMRESPALVRDLVGHVAEVTACAVMADGRRVISSSNDGTLMIWDLDSGRVLETIRGHASGILALRVTGDDRYVISLSKTRILRVCKIKDGRLLGTITGAVAFAVTADDRYLFSSSRDGTLRIRDLGTGQVLATYKDDDATMATFAIAPDGRRLVSVFNSGELAFHNETLTIRCLDDEDPIAVGGREREVCDPAEHTLEPAETVIEDNVYISELDSSRLSSSACAMTSDGQRLVSVLWDSWGRLVVRIWGLDAKRVLATFRGYNNNLTTCAIAPDGRRVIFASGDHTLKVWDLDRRRVLAILEGHAGEVTACAVTPDGRRVVSASRDRTLKVWDLDRGSPWQTAKNPANDGHDRKVADRVAVYEVTRDGRRAISVSYDWTLRIWNLDSGHVIATCRGHLAPVTTCAVTPDGRRGISTSIDETLKIWDLYSADSTPVLTRWTGLVTVCTVTHDSRRVVCASHEVLTCWDLDSGRALAEFTGHSDKVTACAITPDDKHVVSASRDATLKVWELVSGRVLATLVGHSAAVTACTVTPDGRRLVSASEDHTLRVWDLVSGRVLATLPGHLAGVTTYAVLPDSRRVIAASGDRAPRVWDLVRGRVLATLEGHAGSTKACAATPDGHRVISASDDRTLKIWDLDTYACLATHRGDAAYTTVTATATAVIAGDNAGTLWVLDWPRPSRGTSPRPTGHGDDGDPRTSISGTETSSPTAPRKKHTILFLAADPLGSDRLALDREARAIQVELERSGHRDRFEFVTRWAAEPLDLLRELRKLRPTVVHYSGHGQDLGGGLGHGTQHVGAQRVVATPGVHSNRQPGGLFFHGADGHAQLVSAAAIADTFGAAGSSVRLVVLNACYSEAQAAALLAHVDCVVGMDGSILDDAARSFAIGFYGGLGERESVAAAYRQGCAAIGLDGLLDGDRPQLKVRDGVNADRLVLAEDPR